MLFRSIALLDIENIDLMNRLASDLEYMSVHFSKPSWSATGVGILSKIKAKTVGKIEVPQSRDMLHVKLENEGINLIAVHWPAKSEKKNQRKHALKLLKNYTNGMKNLVILGDFNEPLQSDSIFEDEYLYATNIGWFDLWFFKNSKYSYVYGGKKTVLDCIIISQELLGGKGLKYESFEPFVRDFFVDKNGYPKRWQKDGSGYSDHLPLVAKFESNPKAVHVQDVTIEDIFSGRENVRLTCLHKIYQVFIIYTDYHN